MQGRSWMAAWMLAASLVGAGGIGSASLAGGPAPVKQKVQLRIRLDGTKNDSGVEVVIKPGHPACRFKPVTYPVKRDGVLPDILPIEVETLSADRDCSFAIVLKQPGQPDKVFRRSLQINAPGEANDGKPQLMQCYISSRTILTDSDAQPSTPVATGTNAKTTTPTVRK